MKKISLILFVLAAFISAATAQTTPEAKPEKTPEQRAESQAKKWTTLISLTPEQQPKIKAIFLERYTKEKEVKAKYAAAPNEEAMKQETKAYKKAETASLQALLTPQQYSDYLRIKEEQKQAKEAAKAAEEEKK